MMLFNTKNELEQIDFHDCIIEAINIEDNMITFILESVNVLAAHTLNPFEFARNTDQCILEFINVQSYESGYFVREKEDRIDIELVHNNDFEILKFDILNENEMRFYKIFGMASNFNNEYSEILIRAEYTNIKWNKYVSDAWFVNWPKKK
ncbi:hypothetical protein [Paenibacillus hexagrammi]|uniref:Immunity protein 50 of polymorphic toxin system n=1 Tax=Paenibacillus hexagrammi TaxID=2908839 RepID=A0ABY3SNE0_9BACL|nr:hypothetical protein [Paenibacillus sp. YPD9-1]UJF35512.1 hypothetical protein L0M14_10645 [Paenibacillus sp. YPD9-1]